uniref:Reverse transcriptase n=1 Tax=Trichuris muris TaxID=70415 RepID=A0A5S6QSG4_TRIMR
MRETRRHKAEEAVTVDGACSGGDGGKDEGQRCGVVEQRKPSAGAAEGSSRLWCRPPPCFSPGMDVDIWLNRLNDYLEANDVPETKRMAVLKSFVDDEVYSVLAEEGQMATFGELTTCLKRRYGPNESQLVTWMRFIRRRQCPTESLDDFADELRKLGRLTARSDVDLHGQFISGILDQEVQASLVKADTKSFTEAVRMAKHFASIQASVEQVRRCRRTESIERHADDRSQNVHSNEASQTAFASELRRLESRLSRLELPEQTFQRNEWSDSACQRRSLNACFVCGRMGHLSRHCPDRRRPSTNGQPTNNADSTAMSLRPNGNNRQGKVLSIMVNVGGKDVEALVDTGAVSCFAHRNLLLQNGINVDPWVGPAFRGVDGRTVIPVGRAKLTVMYEGQPLNMDVAVLADPPCTLALGTEALMKLGIGIEFSPDGWRINRIVWSSPPTLEEKGLKGTDKAAPSPAVTGRLINEVGSVILRPDRELKQLELGERLATEERSRLSKLVSVFGFLFDQPLVGGSNGHGVRHRIPTGDVNPIQCRPYRVSRLEREAISRQVEEMVRNGIVEESQSSWAFPVVMVRKKDGSWRFCVDYRKLNAVTARDVHPLPRMDDVLDRLGGSKYFSRLDLRNGYWQLEVEENDRPKTAFVTPDGLYQFKRMPFGLANAPATFSRLMNRILHSAMERHCIACLDDILIFTPVFEQHLLKLEQVFRILGDNGLRLNPAKCLLGTHEVEYLGHVIDAIGVRPDPAKIEGINSFPTPRTVKELRRFLGMSGYYRRFVEHYADIANPLYLLLRKKRKWEWSKMEEEAFKELKRRLQEPPVVHHFQESWPIEIHCDASRSGLGAVLIQKKEDQEHVVTYISRKLSATEENYHSNELECLAVVWALRVLRPYVLGRPFRVLTDSSAVKWLFDKRSERQIRKVGNGVDGVSRNCKVRAS